MITNKPPEVKAAEEADRVQLVEALAEHPGTPWGEAIEKVATLRLEHDAWGAVIDGLRARLATVTRERDEARAYVACSFCGHREPKDGFNYDKMAAHIIECKDHPMRAAIVENVRLRKALDTPIPMILHCPRCGLQHVDAPDERTPGWENPPHRSHLCHGCGFTWRPCDRATEGVRATTTRGAKDGDIPERVGQGERDELRAALLNERGEGEPPSEGWAWDVDSWVCTSDDVGNVYVYHVPAGWRWAGDRIQGDHAVHGSAREAMRAADTALAGAKS